MIKKKVVSKDIHFDYRDAKMLQRYVDAEPMNKTGLNAKQQRRLALAVKRARHLALLPFVPKN